MPSVSWNSSRTQSLQTTLFPSTVAVRSPSVKWAGASLAGPWEAMAKGSSSRVPRAMFSSLDTASSTRTVAVAVSAWPLASRAPVTVTVSPAVSKLTPSRSQVTGNWSELPSVK